MGMLETLRKVIRQQTERVTTPVSNLYGTVAGQSPAITTGSGGEWLFAQISGGQMLNLQQFLNAYRNDPNGLYEIIFSPEGKVISHSAISGSPVTFLARGVLNLPADTFVRLRINTGSRSSPFAVYVDGVLQRNAQGSRLIPLTISGGIHLVEIIAVSVSLEIQVPPDIRVTYTLHQLPAPTWKGILSGNVNPQGQSTANLTWYAHPNAGGWIVLRRAPIYHNTIVIVGTAALITDSYSIEVTGDITGGISVGDELYVGDILIGTAVVVIYDNPNSTIYIRMPFTTFIPNQGWVNATLSTGGFVEINRLQRVTQTAEVTWSDTSVIYNALYYYTLQAFGIFARDNNSPLSEVRIIKIGDVTAPGSINLATGFPQVDQGRVRVQFLTPSDADYSGVQAIYRDVRDIGTATAGSVTTLTDTTKNWGNTDFTGQAVRITAGTGLGQQSTISSNTATELTVPSWDVTPDATSVYEIFQLINTYIDYGVPGQIDEFSFNLVGEGTYYFPTFDSGQNLQDIFVGAQWVYDNTQYGSVPQTSILVTNKTQKRLANQSVLGVTLYSIPLATSIFEDTFEEVDNTLFANHVTGLTSDTSGSSPIKLVDTSESWTVDAFVNKRLRILEVGINYGQVRLITSNTATELFFNPPLNASPNSSAYEVIDHAPNVVFDATAKWTVSAPVRVQIIGHKALFTEPTPGIHNMRIDAGRSTDFRLEAVLGRGGSNHAAVGSNLQYRGIASSLFWEYGLLHEDTDNVTLRYRLNSGGGSWTNLATGYPWKEMNSKTLIVELDGDRHVFKIADAFGHQEQEIGRITGIDLPLGTEIGWNLRGTSGDDWIDNIRVLDIADLVRIKYLVSPDDDFLEVIQFGENPVLTATSGSTTSINDTTQSWEVNELINMRVRIKTGTGGGGPLGEDRAIVFNNVDQIIPKTPFSSAVNNTNEYIVYERSFSATERLQFWKTKGSSVKTIKFHGEKKFLPAEAEKRMLIDADNIPEIKVTAINTATSEITVTILPDDDAKRWKLYMRLSGWPTTDGQQNSPLDDRFLKFDGTTETTSVVVQGISDGGWDIITIPYDSDGNTGPFSFTTLDISTGGGGGGDPDSPPETASFFGYRATQSGAPPGTLMILWDHTSNLNKVPETNDTETGTGTISGTSTTLNDTDQSWTTNKKSGRVVYLTGGTGTGASRKIVSNTGTELTVTPAWTTNPASDTTYDIRLGWTVSIFVYDSIHGPSQELALTINRDPWKDGSSGSDSPISKGHYIDGEIEFGVKPIDPWINNTYTIKLYDYDGINIRTYVIVYWYYGFGVRL